MKCFYNRFFKINLLVTFEQWLHISSDVRLNAEFLMLVYFKITRAGDANNDEMVDFCVVYRERQWATWHKSTFTTTTLLMRGLYL